MEKYTEKLLLLSMKFDQSSWRWVRFFGKILGIFPLWYAEYLEKKYIGTEKKENEEE